MRGLSVWRACAVRRDDWLLPAGGTVGSARIEHDKQAPPSGGIGIGGLSLRQHHAYITTRNRAYIRATSTIRVRPGESIHQG